MDSYSKPSDFGNMLVFMMCSSLCQHLAPSQLRLMGDVCPTSGWTPAKAELSPKPASFG